MYTPFNTEARENQRMVNAASMAQSYTDICRKLQKLEGFTGMNATQLLEVANKVFVNPDREAPKMGDKRMKQVSLLAAILRNPSPVKQDCSLVKRGSPEETSTTSRPVHIMQRDWTLEG